MAREATTTAFVTRNRRALTDAGILAITDPWRAAGNVDGAADLLRAWRRRTTDPQTREHLDRLLGDPRTIRADVDDGPTRRQYLGCGVAPVGRRAHESDDTWLETRCLTVFWVPVFPLATFLSDENYVYAKVSMSTWARWVQAVLLGVASLLVAMVSFGPSLAGMGAVALALALAAMHWRSRRNLAAYVAEHAPG